MSGRRGPSVKERRAVSALTDALRTGSLRRSDQQGAADLLSRTLPDVARLPQNALRILARTSLKAAGKIVPDSSDFDEPVRQSVPSGAIRESNGGHEPIYPANSNDLLPSMRPKSPLERYSGPRKKRRVSRFAADDNSSSALFLASRPKERLDDVGGISNVIDTVRELVEWPLTHTAIYDHLGVDPPRGILIHGPSGCGKTLLAHAIAGELGVTFFRVSGPAIVSGMSGESERKLRDLFAEATKLEPSIIFVDEVDAIAARREGASKEMERRIVSQLLSCLDNLSIPRSETPQSEEDGKPTNDQPPLYESKKEHSDHASEVDARKRQKPPSVVVIAATNRPESLEPALRRAGRFDREIELGAPDEEARAAIMSKMSRTLRLTSQFDLRTLAKRTAGYVGADLQLLMKEAGLACVRRFASSAKRIEDSDQNNCMEDIGKLSVEQSGTGNFPEANDSAFAQDNHEHSQNGAMQMAPEGTEDTNGMANDKLDSRRYRFGEKKWNLDELSDYAIAMCDFEEALGTIQPSALREGFATRPNVSWENVGSLEGVREEMMMAIVEPIRRPEMFSALGLHAPAGVLLYGPPGCGKTLLARAVASESGANFISVKGPELLSKYVGDSELAVRKVFQRARSSAPCVIFFDELDALAPRRGGLGAETSGASERVVNMLLTEMDGFSDRQQVFLIAATNRPDIIDPAMLRPGRLDKLVHVPLPDAEGRVSILKTLLRGLKVAPDINPDAIGRDADCEGFSGADLQALIRAAGENALREIMTAGNIDNDIRIGRRHFREGLKVVFPSVSVKDAVRYKGMEKKMRNARISLGKDEGNG